MTHQSRFESNNKEKMEHPAWFVLSLMASITALKFPLTCHFWAFWFLFELILLPKFFQFCETVRSSVMSCSCRVSADLRKCFGSVNLTSQSKTFQFAYFKVCRCRDVCEIFILIKEKTFLKFVFFYHTLLAFTIIRDILYSFSLIYFLIDCAL